MKRDVSFRWSSVFSLHRKESSRDKKKFLCRRSISRAFDYKWYKRFSDDKISTKDNKELAEPSQ